MNDEGILFTIMIFIIILLFAIGFYQNEKQDENVVLKEKIELLQDSLEKCKTLNLETK